MTVSVALSQDTSSGDVKDKPPSPHLVGWTLPQRIFKEGGCFLGNQSSQEYSIAGETGSTERDSKILSDIDLNLIKTVSRMASIFCSLRLPVIEVPYTDLKAEVPDQVYYKLYLCVLRC